LTFQRAGTSTVADVLLTLLSVPECPNADLLLERLRRALDGRQVALEQIVISDQDGARRWGMTGSPTLLVDGVDPFGTADAPASISCRLYRSGDGSVSGAPSLTEIKAALAGASGGHAR
jgi:hypothetical protein